jgi:hypothetical protein
MIAQNASRILQKIHITVAAYIETLQRQGRAAHGQTAHGGHPDAVFLAY